MFLRSTTICIILFSICSLVRAEGNKYFQSPKINKPKVGSVAGWLAGFDPKKIGMAQGEVQIPLPIELPSDRGPIGINIFPTYQISNGISEWGLGWASSLSISRFREVGFPQYNDDDHFSSPWGILRKGSDGYYYGKSSDGMIRASLVDDHFLVFSPDGKTYAFNKSDSIGSDLGIHTWHLNLVSTKNDRHTKLVWESNDSGRLFLSEVYFGGKGDSFQYRVDFTYRKIQGQPFVDYKTGKRLELDQYVDKVLINVLSQGEFQSRWTYQIDVKQEDFSYTYYLKSLTKSYSSGGTEPSTTFRYDLGEHFWSSPKLEKVDGYEDFWSEGGSFLMALDTTIPVDINLDGLLDFKDVSNRSQYIRNKSGFISESMGEFDIEDPSADDRCRDSGKSRLVFSRVKGFNDELSIVKFLSDRLGSHIYICDQQGRLKHKKTFPVRTSIGTRGGFVDINGDGKDEVVIVSTNIKIFQNKSSDDSFLFDYTTTTLDRLEGRKFSQSSSIHFHDMNGDGLLDIVGQVSNGLNVLHGRGNYQFDSKSYFIPFLNQFDNTAFRSSGYSSSFGDLNKDGLTDLIFYTNTAFYPMINQGASLRHFPLEIEDIRKHTPIKPLPLDFEGSGNQQIGIISNVSGLLKVDLTHPSTGLLSSYSDGKGNLVSLTYERGLNGTGMGLGKIVTKTISKQSTGHKDQKWSITLTSPHGHPYQPSIIGYQSIQKKSGPIKVVHNNIFSLYEGAQELSTEQVDERVPNWIRKNSNAFENFTMSGLEFTRPRSSLGEWLFKNMPIGPKNELVFDSYHHGLCVRQSTLKTIHGEKIDTRSLWMHANWDQHLHCKPSEVTVEGIHTNNAYDFTNTGKIDYNSRGQVTHVYRNEEDKWHLQNKVTYNAETFLPESILDTSKGSTTFEFDDQTNLLESVFHQDGRKEVLKRNLVDLIESHSVSRGSSKSIKISFSWTSLEMLGSIWDSISNSSKNSPLDSYIYTFPTDKNLGIVQTYNKNTLDSYLQKSQIISSSNTPLAEVLKVDDDQYWVDSIVRKDLTQSLEESFAPHNVEGQWESMKLLKDAYANTRIARSEKTSFFPDLTSEILWQKDIKETANTRLILDNESRVLVSKTNNDYPIKKVLGFNNELLNFEDQGNNKWSYQYDALNRLRQVKKPDGNTIEIELDSVGRVQKTKSNLVGSIVYHYEVGKDILEKKEFLDVNDILDREEIFTYDSIGRIETRTIKNGELSKVFNYVYDGSHGKVKDQNGFLTRLEEENFIKTWKYRIDGKIEMSTIEFVKEKVQLQLHYDYFDNHLLKSIDTIARSPNKTVSYSKEYIYDELNRLEKVLINERETLSVDYNKQNKVSQLNFTSSKKAVSLLYDEVTGNNRGYDSKENGYSFSYNDRGFIKNETFGNHSRDYLYDDRGYLESYSGFDSDSYSYSDSGIQDIFSESVGTFSRILENDLAKPNQGIGFDTMGRVKVFGETHFIYGTDGNLAKAYRDGVEARYIYDESDQRLASSYKDKVLFKYDDISILLSKDNLQVFNPVKVAGYTVGILNNGEFESHYSDLRGTVLDGDSWSSPYGVRKGVLTKSEIIDFINQGRDPVTGFVRFGKRDYSPKLGSFTTPDPLFLEKPENCIKSPLECNLYSYAKNNPLRYTDPMGTNAIDQIQQGYNRARQLVAAVGVATQKTYHSAMGFVELGKAATSVKWGQTVGHFEANANGQVAKGSYRLLSGVGPNGPTVMNRASGTVGILKGSVDFGVKDGSTYGGGSIGIGGGISGYGGGASIGGETSLNWQYRDSRGYVNLNGDTPSFGLNLKLTSDGVIGSVTNKTGVQSPMGGMSGGQTTSFTFDFNKANEHLDKAQSHFDRGW